MSGAFVLVGGVMAAETNDAVFDEAEVSQAADRLYRAATILLQVVASQHTDDEAENRPTDMVSPETGD